MGSSLCRCPTTHPGVAAGLHAHRGIVGHRTDRDTVRRQRMPRPDGNGEPCTCPGHRKSQLRAESARALESLADT